MAQITQKKNGGIAMKAKIDLEKFVRSLMERYYEKIHIDPTTTKCWLDSVLEDQGLEYKDGEIVEIEQEDLRKWLNFENTHEGITIPKDLKGTDTDGGVVGEKGEEGEPLIEDARIRKAILSGMNFLKFQGRETFGGIAIDDCIAWLKKQSIKEDSLETKAIKEQIENLKKRIEDNQLGCIVQRLDKIIELLQEAILVLPKEPYVPPIIYKRPLDPDPNVLGGWTTTASTFGSDYDIDTDKIK